jgi:hypothetical protein
MVRCGKQPLGWVFVSRMTGIICFLITVVLAKILTTFLSPDDFLLTVINGVLFANFWLILAIAIVLFIADIFGAFPFPLNLPAPIIRAFGSVFVIAFLMRIFQWTDGIAGTSLYQMFWYLSFLIVPLVFLIVLATGYFEIMRQLWWVPRIEADDGVQVVQEVSPPPPETNVSDAKSWEEIGVEFRLMLYDLLHRFRQEIRKK